MGIEFEAVLVRMGGCIARIYNLLYDSANSTKMKPHLTLASYLKGPCKNPFEELVQTKEIKRASPLLGVSEEALGNAWKQVRALPNASQVEELLVHAGDYLLEFLPKLAEFESPELIEETFLADVRIGEDPFFTDPDPELVDSEMDESLNDRIEATIRARFLKLVIYFWHLANVGGIEIAKDQLTEILEAAASHQLQLTQGLTAEQVKFSSTTWSLSPELRNFLSNVRVEPSSGGSSTDAIHKSVASRVAQTMGGADDALITNAVRSKQRSADELLAKGRKLDSRLRAFSFFLVKESGAEELAVAIMAARPTQRAPLSKRSF